MNISNLYEHHWRDILIGLLLAVTFSVFLYQHAQLLPRIVFQGPYGDIWFESDSPRIYNNMIDRQSDHSRAKVHPLFALISYPPVYLMKNIFKCDPIIAVRMLASGVAAVWLVALFALLRLMGCRRLEVVLFCLLACVSAAAMFFFVVPETYYFGSVSLLVAFMVAALAQRRTLSSGCYIAMNVVTLSVTTSNWMAGIFVTITNNTFRRTVMIIGLTLAVTFVGWTIQKQLFPTADGFMRISQESAFLLRPEAGGPANAVRSIYFHTLVMPSIASTTDPTVPGWVGLITQPSPVGSASWWGVGAAVLWSILLLLGFWSLMRLKGNEQLRWVIGLTLVAQTLLHLFYGFETFLYSLHFLVLLIPLAALSTLTKNRLLVICVLVLLIPFVYINNTSQYHKAVRFVQEQYKTTAAQ